MSAIKMVRTILVGVDGSHESDRAATLAGQLAATLGAVLVAVHATGLLDVWPEHPETHGARNSHSHVDLMMRGTWTDPARQSGVEPQLILRDGPPSLVLTAVADEMDADLIIIGTRGAGSSDPFGLGSTAAKLAQRSTRPILIVPGARTRSDEPE